MQVLKDREVLLAHFGFPADHEVHLQITNAIESTFAPVRLLTRKTKGAGVGPPAWPWPTKCWRQVKRAGAPSTQPGSANPGWACGIDGRLRFMTGITIGTLPLHLLELR
jgi:hypothetical protein